MASSIVYDDVKTFLDATLAPTRVINYDDIDSTLEKSQTEFFALEEIYSTDELVAFGDPQNLCKRETSDFLIHAYYPAPHSGRQCRALAGRAQIALEFQQLPNVRIAEVNPPDPQALNDGIWTVIAVSFVTIYDRYVARP